MLAGFRNHPTKQATRTPTNMGTDNTLSRNASPVSPAKRWMNARLIPQNPHFKPVNANKGQWGPTRPRTCNAASKPIFATAKAITR